MMALQLGDIAPDFSAESTQGVIHFHNWIDDHWAILFSHFKDFTPVCSTELGYITSLKPEFEKRRCKIIGLSVDSLDSHHQWTQNIANNQGRAVNFPLIADSERSIAQRYHMIHPNTDNTLTVRSVFVIGPDKRIKLTLAYPANTGRNFDEILRVLDSLQLSAKHNVATPANWRYGEDVIILPTVSDENTKQRFALSRQMLKPYLRMIQIALRNRSTKPAYNTTSCC